MTMMKKGDKNAKKFDELVSEKDGLSDDERMQHAAKQMQVRFKQEELKTGVLLPIPVSETTQSHKHLEHDIANKMVSFH